MFMLYNQTVGEHSMVASISHTISAPTVRVLLLSSPSLGRACRIDHLLAALIAVGGETKFEIRTHDAWNQIG